jgi:KipI family sensor histidine kinase inhibitor
MRVESASDSTLFISFADVISPAANRCVISFFNAIHRLRDARIHNLHPAYSSLLIDFDPLRLTHKELENLLAPFLAGFDSPDPVAARQIEIPVCYEPEFAPDLAEVSERSRLSSTQVVEIHSAADYFVYFLGFSPGFAYLGELPSQLHLPRLATPRKHVHAGSVGIAGAQTGIYPNDSPGGWQLIGRTPLRMFDPAGLPPSRLQPGDRVRFRPIGSAEFKSLAENKGLLG